MRLQRRQALKALILLLFSVFIFILHQTGEITRFINPSYLYFSQIASVLFLFLFFIQVPRIFATDDHDHTLCGPWGCSHEEGEGFTFRSFVTYALIIVPLAMGFMLPYKDFGAAEAVKRGVSYYAHDHQHDHDHEEHEHSHDCIPQQDSPSLTQILNEPILYFHNKNFTSYMSAVTENPHRFIGKPVVIEGFVLEDEMASEIHTVLSRFIVTHCVADAHAAGFIIADGAGHGIEEGQWIRVKGRLNVMQSERFTVPVVELESWGAITQPIDPYIYP